jgi:hypothetical protein
MSEETYSQLISIKNHHIRLAKQSINSTCTLDRKTLITKEIDGLRLQRTKIIDQQRQLLADQVEQ